MSVQSDAEALRRRLQRKYQLKLMRQYYEAIAKTVMGKPERVGSNPRDG